MFHLLFGLPILMTFGAMALFVLTAPFCVGIFLQVLLCVFGQSIWVLLVPAGLGVLGLTCSLVFLHEDIPLVGILSYWGLFFLSLWLVWLVIDQIRKAIVRWRRKE